jgi:hypothetical protein
MIPREIDDAVLLPVRSEEGEIRHRLSDLGKLTCRLCQVGLPGSCRWSVISGQNESQTTGH